MIILWAHFQKTVRNVRFHSLTVNRQQSTSELKRVLAEKIPKEQEKINSFRKTHGSSEIGKITVNQVYGGMRGMLGLICETSVLDPQEGIRFRGYSIPECQKLLPKIKGGFAPLPEGIFWLLLTGDIPTEVQVTSLSAEWVDRAALPGHVATLLKHFPSNLHPMSQFSAAITALNSESKFAKAYSEGIKKQVYWEYAFEDAMDVIAKLPVIAAKIYKNVFKEGKGSLVIDEKRDWSANLAQMMGYDNKDFFDLLRLYLTIHCDHEGGNVSAHTVHLVASALSDPYLSLAAGMNGLAGPLHGLANQQVLLFISNIQKELGEKVTDDQIKEFCLKTLQGGQVIPGYGHTVLRKTDPRYDCQREFALKNLPEDPLFKIAEQLFRVVPTLLKETGKVQNPWPNVDANSGLCLHHYGLTELQFYTVLFGVSRSLGTMASLVWDRALGFPIERPKSISTDSFIKLMNKT